MLMYRKNSVETSHLLTSWMNETNFIAFDPTLIDAMLRHTGRFCFVQENGSTPQQAASAALHQMEYVCPTLLMIHFGCSPEVSLADVTKAADQLFNNRFSSTTGSWQMVLDENLHRGETRLEILYTEDERQE